MGWVIRGGVGNKGWGGWWGGWRGGRGADLLLR